jgi:pimeloyl-ACP methyl ester carboxylesterase
MRDGMATDGAAALARIRCPLLVVRAGAPMDLDRLRGLQPDALVGNVVGSGHWLTLVVPDQVNAMLDRFLELASTIG